MTKNKVNRYQDLKEIEEEEENKIEEELRVEINMKEAGNLEEEKVVPITYEVNRMIIEEVEKVCKQDDEYTPSKDNAKKREEEARFSIQLQVGVVVAYICDSVVLCCSTYLCQAERSISA